MVKIQESKELFRQNLKRLRKRKGLNQSHLASMIGVAPNSISNYENGVSTPDFKLIDKIIKVLDISREELFGLPVEDQRLVETPVESEFDSLFVALELLESRHPEDLPLISQLKSGIMKLQSQRINADQKVIRLLEDKEAMFEAMEKLGVKLR